MIGNEITFCTPLIWEESAIDNAPGPYRSKLVQQIHNFVDTFFHWTKSRIALIEQVTPLQGTRIKLEEMAPIWWHTALKALACFTLVIPAVILLAKVLFRSIPLGNIVYITTKQENDYFETNEHSNEIAQRRVRTYTDGTIEIIQRRSSDVYFGQTKTRIQNGVTEIGYFDASNHLIEGTRIDHNSTLYYDPLLLQHIDFPDKRLAIALVKTNDNQRKVAAVEQASAIYDSSGQIVKSIQHIYHPYKHSLNHALWEMGTSHLPPAHTLLQRSKPLTGPSLNILERLIKEDSFKVADFYRFLLSPNLQLGLSPIKSVTDKNKLFLFNFLIQLDASHLNHELFAEAFTYFMKTPNIVSVKIFLDCIQDQYEKTKKPLNLGCLLGPFRFKTNELPIFTLRLKILERLCILFKQGAVIFECEGFSGSQFLRVTSLIRKQTLFSVLSGYLSTQLIAYFLEMDHSLVTESNIPYFGEAVNEISADKADLVLAAMMKHHIPLTSFETLCLKIKEAPDVTKEELEHYIPKEQMQKLDLVDRIQLLRTARLYKKWDLVELFYAWGIANSYIVRPEPLFRKTLSYLQPKDLARAARVSTQWHTSVSTIRAAT